MLACLGLLLGLAGLRISPGSYSERWNTVMAAQYPRTEPKSRLPTLPRAIFLSLLFAAFPFLKGSCPGFLSHHLLFTLVSICCVFSTGAWLLVAWTVQNSAEDDRAARIEQFMADAKAAVPAPAAGMDAPPTWLTMWKWSNFAMFLLLGATIVNALLPIS
jgi:hypothetical protein